MRLKLSLPSIPPGHPFPAPVVQAGVWEVKGSTLFRRIAPAVERHSQGSSLRMKGFSLGVEPFRLAGLGNGQMMITIPGVLQICLEK